MILFTVVATLFILLAYSKLNLYNHIAALALPWAIILMLSGVSLSYLHKDLSNSTLLVIFAFISCYFAGSIISPTPRKVRHLYKIQISKAAFNLFLCIYIALTAANVIIAGYIPVIKLLQSGNSGYMDFGLSGLYGIYNAYGNALAIISAYIHVKTGKPKYLITYITIIVVFFLFLSRQNIISTIIEVFIVYGFTRERIPTRRILIYTTIILLLFSSIGEMRSGDIREISEANSEYRYLPSIIYWIYSYLYISAVNLDNFILNSGAPFYDGSSLYTLVPRFMRASLGAVSDTGSFLEKINFTVSTSLKNIYGDFGYSQIIISGFAFGFATNTFYKRSKMIPEPHTVATYSVLYFCSLFSFFTNFWFYLPIIFQIPFIYLLSLFILPKKKTNH